MRTKKISKLIAFAFGVMTMLIACAFTFTACGTMYTSKAGTLEDMAGTYKLTQYIQKDEEGQEIDRITQLEVKAYMVVGTNGSGYYVYEDKNTPMWYDSTTIEYNREEEGSELYKSMRMTTGKGLVTIDKQKPGCGYEPVMGFDVTTMTFNYTIPDYRPSQKWIRPSYYTNVLYTKVSDATDLSFVATEMEASFAAIPRYELKNLDGALIFHAGMVNTSIADVENPEYGKYKYYVVDFDAVSEKADIYYELVEGTAGPQVEENVSLNITLVQPTADNYYQHQVIIEFFGKEYNSTLTTYQGPVTYLNYDVYTEPDADGTSWNIYSNWFEKYRGDKTDIADIVADQLAAYNNSQA